LRREGRGKEQIRVVELIVVPWDQVLDVLQESHRKGAGSAIVISAGFAERASTTAPYWVAPCR